MQMIFQDPFAFAHPQNGSLSDQVAEPDPNYGTLKGPS